MSSPENLSRKSDLTPPGSSEVPAGEVIEQDYIIRTPETRIDETTAKLKENAVNLLDISKHLIDGQNLGWAKDKQVGENGETLLKPYTWNVNSGVLLFNDGENTYVTSSNDELLDKLFDLSNGYKKDERIGVPHVNDSGVWKDPYAWKDFAAKWK